MCSNANAMIVCDHNFIWMCFCLIFSTNSFLQCIIPFIISFVTLFNAQRAYIEVSKQGEISRARAKYQSCTERQSIFFIVL